MGSTTWFNSHATSQTCEKWHPDKNSSPEAQQKFIELTEAYNDLMNGQSTASDKRWSRRAHSKPGGSQPQTKMEEALRTFAESVNLKQFMKNGEIDWQKLERSVADLVNTAVETVAGAVKQRYVNDDGTIKWKQVLGDTAVAGAAIFMAAFRDHDEM
eukprot:s2227_g11.t1